MICIVLFGGGVRAPTGQRHCTLASPLPYMAAVKFGLILRTVTLFVPQVFSRPGY